MVYIPYSLYKAQELEVVGNVCEVTEGRILLVITQASRKKFHILNFSKYKYLYVKIASLANVKSYVTIGSIHEWQMFGPVWCIISQA